MLERELAAGGMARVYLAKLRGAGGFEKRLVVKQIRPELASDPGFVERFVKEAKTAVELSHPNIVPVYELGVEQGVYYIAMEHCDGATLSELLSATGPLDVEEGAYLGVEVCRALDYAHRRAHVIHRDVTPRNVLIDEEGAIKLIDFGIAAPVADGDHDARAEVFGSPGHMPPEQIAGRALSPATDVFAVGVLLYEALTAGAQHLERHAARRVVAPRQRRGSRPTAPGFLALGRCGRRRATPRPACAHPAQASSRLEPLAGGRGVDRSVCGWSNPENASRFPIHPAGHADLRGQPRLRTADPQGSKRAAACDGVRTREPVDAPPTELAPAAPACRGRQRRGATSTGELCSALGLRCDRTARFGAGLLDPAEPRLDGSPGHRWVHRRPDSGAAWRSQRCAVRERPA